MSWLSVATTESRDTYNIALEFIEGRVERLYRVWKLRLHGAGRLDEVALAVAARCAQSLAGLHELEKRALAGIR